ncbi:MAG: AAA-like domain-containing protein, partial [Lachnospiraceae bacterium]|nr:AAA-like domain-containing protein [Lachnospiraceae bacterium]
MKKYFNVNRACDPKRHYMVNLDSRLQAIHKMVDIGEYFTINKARQYGKTTTLRALARYLKNDYDVVSLDFQTLSADSFENDKTFVASFANELLDNIASFPDGIEEKINELGQKSGEPYTLQDLFRVLKLWCKKADRRIVLLIDEVDTATNNQFFLAFMAQLRATYLKRPDVATFQSVILAGVHDVSSIRRKIRTDASLMKNSTLNIEEEYGLHM